MDTNITIVNETFIKKYCYNNYGEYGMSEKKEKVVLKIKPNGLLAEFLPREDFVRLLKAGIIDKLPIEFDDGVHSLCLSKKRYWQIKPEYITLYMGKPIKPLPSWVKVVVVSSNGEEKPLEKVIE